MTTDSPRIGFAGPMLGGTPGWGISQHEILCDRFTSEGFTVESTSPHPGRLHRLLDTAWTAGRWRGKVDCVIIAVFSGPGFAVADLTSAIVALEGIPQIQVLHGGDLPRFTSQHPRWARRMLSRADSIVAPSRYLASEVESAGPIEVIPNVFDLDRIPFRARSGAAPRLLWMRTFHSIYDPLTALDVISRVAEVLPEATLTMAGQDTGLERDCRERARELGLGDSVRFPGFLNSDAKLRALEDHDVFLNTNLVDNTPVGMLEAMAAGMPIVSTSVGGIPYLVEDGRTGLLCPAGDADAMAGAVIRLANERDLAARLSTSGRTVAEQSEWNLVRSLWLAQIERAIAARTG